MTCARRGFLAAAPAALLWWVVAGVAGAQDVAAPSSAGDGDPPPVVAEPAPAPRESPPAGGVPGITVAPESAPEVTPDAVPPPADASTIPIPASPAGVTPDSGSPVPEASPVPGPVPAPKAAPAKTPPGPSSSPPDAVSAPPAPESTVIPPAVPWSFSLVTGYYQPRLGTLNRILRDTSLTILQDPNFLLPRNQFFSFEQRNIAVDGLNGGILYGVEAFSNTGGPHSFGLTLSGWRAESIARDRITLFLVSNQPPIEVPRSARYNLVLNQVFAEWRYHLSRDAHGKGVYLNLGFVGVTLATLTMDALVNVANPTRPFASVSSDESFGWGYTSRFGVGGDYPVTSWLFIGGRANYVLGTIRTLKVTKHFLSGFPNSAPVEPLSVRPGVPLPQTFFPPRDGRTITYTEITTTGNIQEDAGVRRNLSLELSGWEGLLEVSLRF